MAKNNVSSLLTSVDELFTTQEERDIAQRETVIDIPLSEISDFPNHPFKVTVDEKMRADGEITKDEYQAMRSPVDAEIRALEKSLEDAPQAEEQGTALNLTEITATLHSLVDFSEATLNHDVIKKFVYMVTPTSDTSFHWYVNLSGNTKARATYTVEGRKKKNVIKLEEIEEISSLHRKENEDATVLIQNPLIFALLHRLLYAKVGNNQLS